MATRDPDFAKHMEALGYVAGMWASLEFVVNSRIWELANVAEDAGACMTAFIPSIGTRMRVYAALAHLRNIPAELYGEINSFSAKAEGLSRERNRVVHDPYAMHSDEPDVRRIRITADRKLDFTLKAVTVAEMNKLYDKIANASDTFVAIHDRVVAASPTFSRTQFLQSKQNLSRRRV